MALILALAAASAIVQARKGRWYAAGGVLLPVVGTDLMLFGALEQHSMLFFGGGVGVSVVGFGMEFVAWRRAARVAVTP
ncbi:hypothetical protein [Streptomyces sp. NPDC051576]|uniref:hypothetical protein n=1 Tax=Streptomyces sp. NPDC051576 TaxID=3155803 RepID=UPI003443A998